jgi:phage terminase Nu1 subunit (DNA packaging protein)
VPTTATPTLNDYARFIGATVKTAQEYLNKHFGSRSERPPMHQFTSVVIAHLRESAAGRVGSQEKLNAEEQRARKDAAQAEHYELRNAALKSELVNAAEIDSALARKDLVLRTNMLGLPSRVASDLVGEDERTIIIRLDEEIRSALTSAAEEIEQLIE